MEQTPNFPFSYKAYNYYQTPQSNSGFFGNQLFFMNNTPNKKPNMFSIRKPIMSLIAIGNPIVDITAEVNKEAIERLGLEWGRTVFADEKNVCFFDELEKKPEVSYTPGGSIENTLRVCSWILNMDQNYGPYFKLTMLGCVGDDNYKDKVEGALTLNKVKPLLQMIKGMKTSRCGVGIYKKERCLLPDIRASNNLTEDFISLNKEEIMKHEALLIEGYFLQEKFDICKSLCEDFSRSQKYVFLTFSAVFMCEFHKDKILEIANKSDIIIGNIEEAEKLAGVKGKPINEVIDKIFRSLQPKDRLLIITSGSKGVYCSKYDYQKGKIDSILQSFPNFIKNEEIVDLNGAGDAFLGGFLAQYLKGKEMDLCLRTGNDAASIILKNVGCTFNRNMKIDLD